MGKETAQNLSGFKHFYYVYGMKKAAVVFNFCLIGNIHHNFLVPRMIELARKTFMIMPIQTLDLHRVLCNRQKLPTKNEKEGVGS